MSKRIHDLLTITLYVYIFLAPILLARSALNTLNAYHVKDRAKEFCADCGDGISLTDYLVMNKAAVELGYRLSVNVTRPGEFYTNDELIVFLEDKDMEIVPGTLVEVYLEKDKIFVYESETYIVESGRL